MAANWELPLGGHACFGPMGFDREYKGCSQELINELVALFSPTPRVLAIDSEPPDPQPPRASTVGQRAIQGVKQ